MKKIRNIKVCEIRLRQNRRFHTTMDHKVIPINTKVICEKVYDAKKSMTTKKYDTKKVSSKVYDSYE